MDMEAHHQQLAEDQAEAGEEILIAELAQALEESGLLEKDPDQCAAYDEVKHGERCPEVAAGDLVDPEGFTVGRYCSYDGPKRADSCNTAPIWRFKLGG